MMVVRVLPENTTIANCSSDAGQPRPARAVILRIWQSRNLVNSHDEKGFLRKDWRVAELRRLMQEIGEPALPAGRVGEKGKGGAGVVGAHDVEESRDDVVSPQAS
jgi:hypothetical protein